MALVLTFLVIVLPLISISYFVCWRSIAIFSDMPSIGKKVEKGLDDTFKWMDKKFHLKRGESQEIVMESLEELQKEGEMPPVAPQTSKTHGNGKIIGKSVKVSSALLTGFFLTLVYTFLLLLYRSAIKKFFLVQFGPVGRPGAARYLLDIQRITQQYLYGIIIVMVILGTLNSIGLWVIGLEYAFFFGFLAAFLAIIPYVGTFIGGALPFAYALATTDEWWQPVAVVILFLIVQLIEGNFITPKVAGSSVQLNPLASIFILFVGGAIWGIVGMVLALPMLAIVKVTCRYIPFLRPVSLLLSSHLYDRESLFDEKFDHEKYRLWGFFSKRAEP
jgi:predicted PurR-regulated permease PerM